MSAQLALIMTMQWGEQTWKRPPCLKPVVSLITLTAEQWSKFARSFGYMDLCAGLGATLIGYEAIRRALEIMAYTPMGDAIV